MDRRTFNKLAGLTTIGALTNAEVHPQGREVVALEDDELRVVFDAATGALIHLIRKSTGWTVQRRPQLGISFRLLAPLPKRRSNFVHGPKQMLASLERISAQKVRFQWKNLLSDHGGILPITFTATITLENGALNFESELINNSHLVVETVDYPFLGDLTPPDRGARMTVNTARYDNLETSELYPHFANELGYWGVDFPTKTRNSFNSLFCLVQSTREGLYVEMRDPTAPYLVQYTFEQHPGVLSNSAPFSSDGSFPPDIHMVPETNTISGVPVHLEFRTCHFVFVHPGETRRFAPIVLRCYSGDWHAGVDLYKQWRATWYKEPQVPEWARDVNSWQQLQINSSEEEYRIPYKKLVEYGEDCARNDVAAIQLVGWNHGGQDRGNPSQDTDPGLGTWDELRDAIARIHAMGVKIILFGKFPWADMTTDWYKNELYKYRVTDPYGITYQYPGDSYHTPTQLAAINNRPFAVMDFCCEAYREIAAKEFRKVLDLKPAGFLYDEVCWHGPGIYSFSPDHGYKAPGFNYSGDLPLGKRLRDEANSVDSDFLFAGEGPQDWLTQYYPVSYFRGSNTPIERYIAPHLPIMVAVNGFDDREQLNLTLRYRYIISYEPYNFKGRLGDFPLTLAYGKKIDALRRRYREYLWDAEFRDTLGATLSSDGAPQHTVFIATSGRRAVVIVNPDFRRTISVTVNLPDPGALVTVSPEEPEAKPTSGNFEVPARSAVVVLEQ